MIIKKVFFLLVMTVSFSFVAQSQGTGTYIIPPGSPATTSTVDSIVAYLNDTNNVTFSLDEDTLGVLMWFSEPYEQFVSNKMKSIGYLCMENNFVKMDTQYDTLFKSIDYETKTISLDSSGNEFWTDPIIVNVIDSTQIKINSLVNVTAKIYKAYDIINPQTTSLTVIGNGIDQFFTVSLESGKTYIIAFIKNGNSIVNIKRIGG